MKKVVNKPVIVSTVSTAVVLGIGITAMFVGRRVKQEQPVVTSIYQKMQKSTTNFSEIYKDDNDLGYC